METENRSPRSEVYWIRLQEMDCEDHLINRPVLNSYPMPCYVRKSVCRRAKAMIKEPGGCKTAETTRQIPSKTLVIHTTLHLLKRHMDEIFTDNKPQRTVF